VTRPAIAPPIGRPACHQGAANGEGAQCRAGWHDGMPQGRAPNGEAAPHGAGTDERIGRPSGKAPAGAGRMAKTGKAGQRLRPGCRCADGHVYKDSARAMHCLLYGAWDDLQPTPQITPRPPWRPVRRNRCSRFAAQENHQACDRLTWEIELSCVLPAGAVERTPFWARAVSAGTGWGSASLKRSWSEYGLRPGYPQ